ncbi:MAG TPA: hypothetical protein VME44_10665 [Streptosporangiaceae bacterium]|nr:hypothetical protein [Streptosporangiaceae bacterium]
MLLVADGFGDGFGDGVALLVADGVGDGVPLGVAEGVGAGSALGEALGVADGDEAVAEADGEGLGSADALIGRMMAAPAVRTPTTARTAVRAPTSIRPPRIPIRTDNTSHDQIAIYYPNDAGRLTLAAAAFAARAGLGLAFWADAERV